MEESNVISFCFLVLCIIEGGVKKKQTNKEETAAEDKGLVGLLFTINGTKQANLYKCIIND